MFNRGAAKIDHLIVFDLSGKIAVENINPGDHFIRTAIGCLLQIPQRIGPRNNSGIDALIQPQWGQIEFDMQRGGALHKFMFRIVRQAAVG